MFWNSQRYFYVLFQCLFSFKQKIKTRQAPRKSWVTGDIKYLSNYMKNFHREDKHHNQYLKAKNEYEELVNSTKRTYYVRLILTSENLKKNRVKNLRRNNQKKILFYKTMTCRSWARAVMWSLTLIKLWKSLTAFLLQIPLLLNPFFFLKKHNLKYIYI